MSSELAASCCCSATPGQCVCAGCPTAYAAAVDFTLKWFGVNNWMAGVQCADPWVEWTAAGDLTGGGDLCAYQDTTPDGSLALQTPAVPCAAPAVIQYDGSVPLNPYWLRLTCVLTSQQTPAVQALLTTPTAWAVQVNIPIMVSGLISRWFTTTCFAFFDRPSTCWAMAQPKCIQLQTNVYINGNQSGSHEALIVGPVGSAVYSGFGGVQCEVDWNVSIL